MVVLDSWKIPAMERELEIKGVEVTIQGRVQGVGFRPFVFQLAKKYQLNGTIQNNLDGVFILIEGEERQISSFLQELREKPPRLARIDDVYVNATSTKNSSQQFTSFNIIASERTGKSALIIPVDSAVCEDCLAEMNNPQDVRYRYPFINCTQCGPRYTIISELPYDRQYTSMNSFIFCDTCKVEYQNPLDRRYHAQPIACPVCGPTLKLFSVKGNLISSDDQAVEDVIAKLKRGFIVAIKGLGGYHLVCDATNEQAIAALRKRKNRPARPLAVMASSIETVRKYCITSPLEEKVITSPEAPIVLLEQKEANSLPNQLAPGLRSIGVMLPYTPLHHLLLEDKELPLIVLTSANPSGMPILFKDEEALSYLSGITDFILTHNREILHPLDDSVVQVIEDEVQFVRRSRGYVPEPLITDQPVNLIIAFGGQQKSTFAIGRNKQIFIGPHIGDMENEEIISFYLYELKHFQEWLGRKGETFAIDQHPNYTTKKIANTLIQQENQENEHALIVKVQHHHAHHVACLEENYLTQASFGIVLDGTGYGEDGNLWGFEIIYGDRKDFKRLAHLAYTPLPGSEKAIREPWRAAVGMLIGLLGEEGRILAQRVFPTREQEIFIINQMIENDIHSPLAGTCGRLFDTVSAILDICQISTYDGEAAIKLSEKIPITYVDIGYDSVYPYQIIESKETKGLLELNVANMLKEVIHDRFTEKSNSEIVRKFHQTLVDAIFNLLERLTHLYPNYNRSITLSGGSFHNRYLFTQLKKGLKSRGFKVYTNKKVPPNDGGLALGQIIIAANSEPFAPECRT